MHLAKALVTSLCSLSALALAQPHGREVEPTTSRHLVIFRDRSFDLASFRIAVRRNDARAVATEVAKLEQRAVEDTAPFAEFVQTLGGKVTERFWLIPACSIEVAADQLERVRRHRRVALVHADTVVRPLIRDATSAKGHNTDAVHRLGIRGVGVSVAIMDTGVDSNTNNLGRPHRTFYVNGDPNDRSGAGLQGSRLVANYRIGQIAADNAHPHGTGVAGIAAGGNWGTSAAGHGHAYGSNIVSYSIADFTNGSAYHSTIARAWQKIAADAVRHKIVVANNSYAGSPSPAWASQLALDACAANAGVLPIVGAGNNASSTANSQSAANGLAVGATDRDGAKRVASFSSRGPLSGDTRRFYPDLCANGVGTVMPAVDQESRNFVASGTSMAAPQVAGAATLFRAANRNATGLETKAALLLTTESVVRQNSTAPFDSRNAYGLGYLRTDRLLALPTQPHILQTAQLTTANRLRKFSLQVKSGRTYGAVIAWHRHTTSANAWSDLDLSVRMSNRVLARSASPRNLYEKVVFFALADGVVEFTVDGKRLEKSPLPFAIAAGEIGSRYFAGTATEYGTACAGSGATRGPKLVVPTGLDAAFGNSGNLLGIGSQPHRYQQICAEATIAQSFTATALWLRHDDKLYFTGYAPATIDITIAIGPTSIHPNSITSRFSSNVTATMTQVLPKTKLQLPKLTGPNTDPRSWQIKVPLARSFVFRKTAGSHLLLDITKSATSSARQNDYFYSDAVQVPSQASTLFHTSLTNQTGWISRGFGSVFGFTTTSSNGVRPLLRSSGRTDVGDRYTLELLQARSQSAALLTTGLSSDRWGALTLPLDLTPFGAAGCRLLTSIELVVPLATDGNGVARQVVPLPRERFLIGTRLFHQMLVLDPPANRFGVVTSSGIAVEIGGQS